MAQWAIMEVGTLRVCSTWQATQATWAARRSPGLTKRMKSGDSRVVAAPAIWGLAPDSGQRSLSFGWTWEAFLRASYLAGWTDLSWAKALRWASMAVW